MAVAERASGKGTGSGQDTSAAITMPAAIQTGDLMILAIGLDNEQTITTPSGWNVIQDGESAAGTVRNWTAWRIKADGDGNFTVSFSGSARYAYGIDAFTGQKATGFINNGSVNIDDNSGATVTADEITTADDNSMLVFVGVIDSNSTFSTYSSPLVETIDVSQGTAPSLCIGIGIQVTAGASGAKTAVATTGARYVGTLFAIYPSTVTTHSGTAPLTSTGALAGTGLLQAQGAAPLASGAVLAPAGLQLASATASLVSGAALGATAVIVSTAAAPFTSTGALVAAGLLQAQGVAPLTSGATLASDATVVLLATAAFTSGAALAAAGLQAVYVSAAGAQAVYTMAAAGLAGYGSVAGAQAVYTTTAAGITGYVSAAAAQAVHVSEVTA